jgi:hypothetical protein
MKVRIRNLALLERALRISFKFLPSFLKKSLRKKIDQSLDLRENRIHPFVAEALALLPSEIRILTDLTESHEYGLKDLFKIYGSDKETRHSYAWVYSELLGRKESPKILEIGLGSLNGFPYGGLPPGGSIKAWRAKYPEATIVGADIDPESVDAIDEIGIVVDQTSDSSLRRFKSQLSEYGKFDLIVDDGFHDPHANVRTYLHVYELMAEDGYYVIEDVHGSLIDFWRIIGTTLPGNLTIYDLRNQRPETEDNILLVFSR